MTRLAVNWSWRSGPVSVKATDAAGNTSSDSGKVTVDATAPSAPSVALKNDTGTSGDLITNDGTLAVIRNQLDIFIIKNFSFTLSLFLLVHNPFGNRFTQTRT